MKYASFWKAARVSRTELNVLRYPTTDYISALLLAQSGRRQINGRTVKSATPMGSRCFAVSFEISFVSNESSGR